MEEWHKKVMEDNMSALKDSLIPNPVLYDELKSAKLLTQPEVEELKRMGTYASFGGREAKDWFFTFIMKGNFYNKLIEVMDKQLQTNFTEILKKGMAKEMERRLEDSDALKKVKDFIYNTEPYEVTVKLPDSGSVDKSDDFYKLEKDKKRWALIININDFDSPAIEKRVGADVDTKAMRQLMKGVGFKVFPKTKDEKEKSKYTKGELIKVIEDFSNECGKNKVNACLVYVASHGYHDRILTSEGDIVDIYEDIVYKFSHSAVDCYGMQGRPKIFIFSTCQDFYKPKNTQPLPLEQASKGARSPLPVEQTKKRPRSPSPVEQTRKRPRLPTTELAGLSRNEDVSIKVDINDTIVILPQVPGCSSNRDKHRGTWFVAVFVYVMMNLAHDVPLGKILEKVQEFTYQIEGTTGDKQLPTFHNMGFKTMYFFPRKV